MKIKLKHRKQGGGIDLGNLLKSPALNQVGEFLGKHGDDVKEVLNGATGALAGSPAAALAGPDPKDPPGTTLGVPAVPGMQLAQVAPGAPGDTQVGPPIITKSISDGFNSVYRIMCMMCILSTGVLFGLGLYDILMYIYKEMSQYFKLNSNVPTIYTKDTTDFTALDYVGGNPKDEPYHIFAQQQIIGFTFLIVSMAVVLIGIEYGAYYALKLYMSINDKKFNEVIDINTEYLKIIIVVGLGCQILSATYKALFVKYAQPKMKKVRTDMRSIKSFIYLQLSTNADFLSAMNADDIGLMISVIQTKLNEDNTNTCDAGETPCQSDLEVEKMVFTYCLYNYFKYLIPENDDSYHDVMKLFDIDNIKHSRTVDPTNFFFYKQSLFVSNIYTSMRNDIIGPPSNPRAFLRTSGTRTIFDVNREKAFINRLNHKLERLNIQLSNLYSLPKGKQLLWIYMVSFCVYTFALFVLIIVLDWAELGPYAKMAMEKIQIFIDNILRKIGLRK